MYICTCTQIEIHQINANNTGALEHKGTECKNTHESARKISEICPSISASSSFTPSNESMLKIQIFIFYK